ncbi:MAG TPA: TetR family transcriptional regulator [Acidimicrobiales bacterium]|nr:TetR family transcriptional regulator [Acidimicrobiales bacterium]
MASREPARREDVDLAATDGRLPGRRGRATRQRLLECTAELLEATPWRSIKVIDIARQAGTSPATFYQYFENVEQAILVLAEELVEGAGNLAQLVEGDWSEDHGWDTARAVVQGFMDYWEANRSVFRVVELATEEGDLRFRGLRVRALNAVTVTLARVVAAGPGGAAAAGPGSPAGADPMAVAATVISMLAHVAAHRYGFEFWGIRTTAMVDSQARFLLWAVTGRSAPESADTLPPPRTGPAPGGGAGQARLATARRPGSPASRGRG